MKKYTQKIIILCAYFVHFNVILGCEDNSRPSQAQLRQTEEMNIIKQEYDDPFPERDQTTDTRERLRALRLFVRSIYYSAEQDLQAIESTQQALCELLSIEDGKHRLRDDVLLNFAARSPQNARAVFTYCSRSLTFDPDTNHSFVRLCIGFAQIPCNKERAESIMRENFRHAGISFHYRSLHTIDSHIDEDGNWKRIPLPDEYRDLETCKQADRLHAQAALFKSQEQLSAHTDFLPIGCEEIHASRKPACCILQ